MPTARAWRWRLHRYRTVRGRTLAGGIVDESAFLRADDSALPDKELVRALRPGLLTLHGLLAGDLIAAS